MNVEGLAQQRAAHGRALDMPAWPTCAIAAGPLGLVGLGGFSAFPQHKIEWIVLAVLHGDTLARLQLIQRLARQLAVTGKLAHRVVHITIACAVSQPLVLQLADDGEHLRHVLGSARFMRGALNTQCIRILMQRFNHAVGQATDGFAILDRPLDDLVFNIGDIAHIGHPVATRTQPALHHIKRNHRARMPQMAQVVHRHTADIHADVSRLHRGKRLQRTR